MRNDTHDNDNEPLTFQALGLAAALVVNRIRNAQALRELANSDEEKDGKGNPGANRTETGKETPEREREYIEHRLRELAAWERKIDGNKKRRL